MKLSIIIPAHNEEKRIGKTLKEYSEYFNAKYKKNFEIIVVLNGCTDNTLNVVNAMSKFLRVRHLEFRESGKGFAILKGFKAARGEFIGFTDADCATSPYEFDRLIENINGYDGIIASRWIKGSIVEPKQPLSRIVASRIFNFFVRALFGLSIRDTQCGAKLFKKRTIKSIIKEVGITEWAFDIDLMYLLKRKGFRVKEMPTVWEDVKGSKLNLKKTSIEMLFSAIRLRLIYSPLKFIVRFYDDVLPEQTKFHHRLKK